MMNTNNSSNIKFSESESCKDVDNRNSNRFECFPANVTKDNVPHYNGKNKDIRKMEQTISTTKRNIINENSTMIKNFMNRNNENSVENKKNDIFRTNRKKEDRFNEINMTKVTSIDNVSNTYNNSDCKDATNPEEDINTQKTVKELYNRSNENGMKWVEIGEASMFWDALKKKFQNAFQQDTEKKNQEKVKKNKMTGDNNQIFIEKNTLQTNKKTKQEMETNKKINKQKDKDFFIPVDVFAKCLNFLSVEKILEIEGLNKLSSNIINTRSTIFKYVKILHLNEKWAKLSIFKRQFYMHQMEYIRHLKVSEKVFFENGIYIHEVAAIIFQNVSTLKSIELLSPELHLTDGTPTHEPFSYAPCCFEKLEKLTIIGCQTLEWLHIFRNASFPVLKKFEVCYYPLTSDNEYWKHNFDFTILGVQGLYKALYTMKNVQKVTIGFDVMFENANGEMTNPIGSRRNLLEPYSVVRYNNSRATSDTISIPPVIGYPSRRFKSYRGRLCEEDYSDLFSITYYIAGKYGKLKRIMIRYKNIYEVTENENESLESINEFVTGAANKASVCYNYVVNWFRSPNDI